MSNLDKTGLTYLWNKINSKIQDTLISGTNIKTINNISLLGNGEINASITETQDTIASQSTTSFSVTHTVTKTVYTASSSCHIVATFTRTSGTSYIDLRNGTTVKQTYTLNTSVTVKTVRLDLVADDTIIIYGSGSGSRKGTYSYTVTGNVRKLVFI